MILIGIIFICLSIFIFRILFDDFKIDWSLAFISFFIVLLVFITGLILIVRYS